jgi:hypothetical protein
MRYPFPEEAASFPWRVPCIKDILIIAHFCEKRMNKRLPVAWEWLAKYAELSILQVRAPVAQWIEQWPPEPCAGVRLASGVLSRCNAPFDETPLQAYAARGVFSEKR